MRVFSILLIFVMVNSKSFSQDLESLLSSEPIYVIFEEGEKQVMTNKNHPDNKLELTNSIFMFYFPNNLYFSFGFLNFKDEFGNKRLETKKVKKSFFKTKKNLIFTYDRILNNGVEEMADIFWFSNRKIYLIDKKDFKNRKVILRQVDFFSSTYTE